MYSWRGRRSGGGGRRGGRSRAKGCLLLVLLVIVVLIILSLMFGGFQKGTKSGSLGSGRAPAVAFASQFPAAT
jgi:predicted metalloprotease